MCVEEPFIMAVISSPPIDAAAPSTEAGLCQRGIACTLARILKMAGPHGLTLWRRETQLMQVITGK